MLFNYQQNSYNDEFSFYSALSLFFFFVSYINHGKMFYENEINWRKGISITQFLDSLKLILQFQEENLNEYG